MPSGYNILVGLASKKGRLTVLRSANVKRRKVLTAGDRLLTYAEVAKR